MLEVKATKVLTLSISGDKIMKKMGLILCLSAVLTLAGCSTNQAPGANLTAASANTSANANAIKPVAVAPTADLLLSMDRQATDAYFKGDAKFFDGFLSEKFIMSGGGQHMNKAAVVKMIGETKCTIKEGWKLEDPQTATIDADTVVMSYKATVDGSCAEGGGKQTKVPSPVRGASIYIREGDKWKAGWHGETPILDPKKPAKLVAVTPGPVAKEEKPAGGDANTDALIQLETAGWEAWKARDEAKLGSLVKANLAIVGGEGNWINGKEEVMKYWISPKCDIKSVSVTNGSASALSPTLELLTFRASATGNCDGQKLGSYEGTSVYMKDGNDWKLVFSFTQPAG